jgi:hypothetical protein
MLSESPSRSTTITPRVQFTSCSLDGVVVRDEAVVGREEFRARVGRGTAPLKAQLLDQGVIAGVGNLLRRAHHVLVPGLQDVRLSRNPSYPAETCTRANERSESFTKPSVPRLPHQRS